MTEVIHRIGNNDAVMMVDELQAAGIITETDDDLELTDEFRDAWHGEIDRLGSGDRRSYLSSFFQADRGALNVQENPDGSVTVRRDGERIGEWPSKVAIDADVAAFLTLQDWLPEWSELSGTQRDELVARLRLFLSSCPACDADLTVEESAATPKGVPRLRCPACDVIVS